jgi:hypothetical protein
MKPNEEPTNRKVISTTPTVIGSKMLIADSIPVLTAQIAMHIQEGWSPSGAIQRVPETDSKVCQVMVRYGVRGRDFAPG